MSAAPATVAEAPPGSLPHAQALLPAALLLAAAVMLAPRGAALLALAAAAALAGLALHRAARGRMPAAVHLGRVALLSLLALALNALFHGGEPLIAAGRPLPVSAEGVRAGAATGLRLAALALLFQGLASAVAPLELLGAIERALRPWRGRGAQGLTLVSLVALRLAPGLAAEAHRLAVQRALRGPWPGPQAPRRQRQRLLAPRLSTLARVLVPLTLLVLRRAEQLAWALPARYYGLGPRTPAAAPRWRAREWAALAAGVAACAWAVWARSSA